ncbi:nuclear transport factor 2 family protein [Kitasatospora sp. LaBMicrA B282]|uniref:nuclear transport factor 2 family protein n=1 Tax=Kitasatospora sp. LaBMicrA B282 TaxID=3420949 RepID=UPI003D0DB404
MSEQNKQLVTDYLETVWNQGKVEEAKRFVAENLIQHNPNLPDGLEPLVGFLGGFKTQVPDGKFAIARTAAEGDLVFVHSHFTAAPGHAGMAVVDVFRIEDGLIAEHWDLSTDVPETTASGHPIV